MSNENKAIDLTRVIARSYPIFQHIPIPTEQNIWSTRHVWYEEDKLSGPTPAKPLAEGADYGEEERLDQQALDTSVPRENYTQIFEMSAEGDPQGMAELLTFHLLSRLEWALINGVRKWGLARSMGGVLDFAGRDGVCSPGETDHMIFLAGPFLAWGRPWAQSGKVIVTENTPEGVIVGVDPRMVQIKALRPFHEVKLGRSRTVVTGEYTIEVRGWHSLYKARGK